jgi:hypothetical protein
MGPLVLESLEIQGFRVFRRLQIPHLRRVNLITGRNGVGKSCLLEALRLYASPACTRGWPGKKTPARRWARRSPSATLMPKPTCPPAARLAAAPLRNLAARREWYSLDNRSGSPVESRPGMPSPSTSSTPRSSFSSPWRDVESIPSSRSNSVWPRSSGFRSASRSSSRSERSSLRPRSFDLQTW